MRKRFCLPNVNKHELYKPIHNPNNPISPSQRVSNERNRLLIKVICLIAVMEFISAMYLLHLHA